MKEPRGIIMAKDTVTISKREYELLCKKANIRDTVIDNLNSHLMYNEWFPISELKDLYDKHIDTFDNQLILIVTYLDDSLCYDADERTIYHRVNSSLKNQPILKKDGFFDIATINSNAIGGYIRKSSFNYGYAMYAKIIKY